MNPLKELFLRQKTTQLDWSTGKKLAFWLWNLLFLLGSALGIGVLSLALTPMNGRLALMKTFFQIPKIALLNLAPVVLCLLLLYFITNRAALAYALTAALVLGFTVVSYFKVQFRNDPFIFEDLLLVKEAGNMAGNYQLFLTKTLAAAGLVTLAGLLFLLLFVRGRSRGAGRYLGLTLTLCLCFPVADMIADEHIYTVDTANNALINQWNATQVYLSKGFVYPFLHSATQAVQTAPEGYSSSRAQAILSNYEDADIPADQQVNVISLMLEAYNDFRNMESDLEINPEVYRVFDQLESEGISGNLVTNIFAGGTVNSERCFLTGYTDLPSFRGLTNSYPWYFRDQGYYTDGAHGCYNWFYNRLNVNENIGFTDYHFVEDYFADQTGGDVAYDPVFFPGLLKLWENRPKDQPYFAYHLSYQGHGPYNTERTWFGDDNVVDKGYETAHLNILNNYFGSIRDTNAQLETYFEYYRNCEEPVIIVMFGDHNPWMGDGNAVYNALGIDLVPSTPRGFYQYYSTRYLIWANDAAKATLGKEFSGEGPTISPNYLMAELFEACGWEGPATMQAAAQVKEQVPVINTASGIYVENGTPSTLLTPEGAALVEDYNSLLYYTKTHFAYDHLLDK